MEDHYHSGGAAFKAGLNGANVIGRRSCDWEAET